MVPHILACLVASPFSRPFKVESMPSICRLHAILLECSGHSFRSQTKIGGIYLGTGLHATQTVAQCWQRRSLLPRRERDHRPLAIPRPLPRPRITTSSLHRPQLLVLPWLQAHNHVGLAGSQGQDVQSRSRTQGSDSLYERCRCLPLRLQARVSVSCSSTNLTKEGERCGASIRHRSVSGSSGRP